MGFKIVFRQTHVMGKSKKLHSMKLKFKQISNILSIVLVILFYSRYFWIKMGYFIDNFFENIFGLIYWFVILSILINLFLLLRNLKKIGSGLIICLVVNIMAIGIYYLDYDFTEKYKAKAFLEAEYLRSKDEGLKLILREDKNFELFQTNNMLSKHSFNYGKFSWENDTLFLLFNKKLRFGKFINKKLSKLILVETQESIYKKGFMKYFKDYALYPNELDYFRFEIIAYENSSP